jgi:8-oxo-dGTP pyrophosphatase MutT (NUDIX family)
MSRELLEEAGVACSTFVAVGHLRLRIAAARPANYPYPYPDSYIGMMSATLGSLPAPRPALEHECDAAAWVPLELALERCADRPWVALVTYLHTG